MGGCGGSVQQDGDGAALVFDTAMSNLLSPLKSPTLTVIGDCASKEGVLGGEGGGGGPCGGSVEQDGDGAAASVATAKSGKLSPLKSLLSTSRGLLPVLKLTLLAKVGVVAPAVVVFKRIETIWLTEFVTAKSSFPSPLKSSMLRDQGLLPLEKSTLEAKVGVVAAVVVVLSRMEAVVVAVVRRC